jgi:hypothetical protein
VLVGDHFLSRDFGPHGIIFTNVCIVITVAMVTLLRNIELYRVPFMTMSIYYKHIYKSRSQVLELTLSSKVDRTFAGYPDFIAYVKHANQISM